MKKLSLYLFLLLFALQTPSLADDIRDFQIEGMSIEDSLLDYFSEEKISKFKKRYYPKSKKYYRIIYYSNLNEYDALTIAMKSNDKKYVIHGLSGNSDFDDMVKCNLKRKSVEDEISSIIPKHKKESYIYNYPNDKSVSQVTNFEIQGGMIRTYCTDYSKSKEEKNFRDHLGVNLSAKDYVEWIFNEAR